MPAVRAESSENSIHRRRRFRALGAGALALIMVGVASASYEVRPGDTLARIAADNGTTVAALAEANAISNPNLIRIGQTLVIPGGDDRPPASYTVAFGDTLASIAVRHGSTVAGIAEVNGLRNPNRIYVGQVLAIPSQGAAAPPRGAPAGEQPPSGDDPAPAGGASPVAGERPDPPKVATVTHVVQPGESLAGIARKYGISASALASANGITNTNVIYSGATLVVSDRAVDPVIASMPTTGIHLVAAGETLSGIAGAYGTTLADLTERNGIANPNLIQIGLSLEVPGVGWVCPVTGARYFNDWGFPRSGGRFHQGNDLFAPRGTEIRAPVGGTLTQRTGTIGGLQFWLEGEDGNLYIGTHMDAFGAGGQVRAGDVIGYIGDSGNAIGSSPHVHFEIHVAGSPVNPYPTLRSSGC